MLHRYPHSLQWHCLNPPHAFAVRDQPVIKLMNDVPGNGIQIDLGLPRGASRTVELGRYRFRLRGRSIRGWVAFGDDFHHPGLLDAGVIDTVESLMHSLLQDASEVRGQRDTAVAVF
jgi:hypothetical protein